MRTFLKRLKTAILGAPIATESARPVAVRTRVAVAVFGIGMLSSVAYAPDAVIDALRGGGLTSAVPWMAAGVVMLMLLLGFAYRDNVRQRATGFAAHYAAERSKQAPGGRPGRHQFQAE